MKKNEYDAMDVIVEQLRHELSVDVCSLYIVDGKDFLFLAESAGLNPQVVGAKLHFTQGLTGKVASTRKSLSV